jgi:serine/threonine-protein kinase
MDDRVLNLARAVSDGSNVDWQHAETSAADDAERRVVAQLRQLAAVSEAARAHKKQWGPLVLREEIGEGAFGTVYRAWDPRLEREVALKLRRSRDEHGRSIEFVKEGRLLAKLRHPNVVTVFGANQYQDAVGLWMELVTGRTLKQIVEQQGPLGPHEAALIGRDLCRALAAVHALGFVHRDVKAQNVMREAGGRTVLMDFGAGVSLISEPASHRLAGTPVYLAPELLQGAAATARSDIYSLGVLLYYLVTSRFPVTGQTLAELTAVHASGGRTLLRDARPDLPEEFVRAIDRATAADPRERPESAGAFERLLQGTLGVQPGGASSDIGGISRPRPSHASTGRRRLSWAAAALAAITTMGIGVTVWRRPAPQGMVRRDSVAIVPLVTIGDTPDGEYLTTGITQDVVSHLAALRGLRIIAGTSTLRYKDEAKSPTEIGRTLGVTSVLDGSVQRVGDTLHVVVRLSDGVSGEQLWSEVFERDVRDVFAMQSEISRKVAIALRGELSQEDIKRLQPTRGRDFEVLNLYAKGRQYWALRTEDAVNRAVQYFQDAIARDPEYAPAYAGLSDAYTSLGAYGVLPRAEARKRAAEAAEKALALDPTLPEAHASLGFAQKNRFEWNAAEASFKRAITLRPGAPLPHHWYAILLTQRGRFPEAITEIKSAIALDPLSIGANLQFASVLFMARRYADAIAQWQHALQLDASFVNAYRGMATSYAYLGLYDRALEQAAEALRKLPVGADDVDVKTDFACVLALAGKPEEALKIAGEFNRRYDTAGEQLAGSIAAIFATLGQNDRAFHWLQIAVARRDPEAGYLKVDPRWDGLRSDPRFAHLLSETGLDDTH